MATISEALRTALELHGAGRRDEAVALCDRILAVDPNHGPTLYFAGTLLCQLARFDEARSLLVRAVVQDPGLIPAHANLAKIDAGAGDWANALASSRRVIALAPADAPAWDLLGTAAHRGGRSDAAIAALQRAHRLAPGANHQKLGVLLFERGRSHLEARRNERALSDLTVAASLLPFDADLGFARAVALIELGRTAEGIALCRRLTTWNPASAPLLHVFGLALTQTGGDGLSILRRASALDPDNPDPCEALAMAFDGKDPEEALRWSTRALSLKLRAIPPAPPEPLPEPAAGRTLDVVSFSLWGSLEIYCGGAIDNARRIARDLPGWRCRFYHDDSVPAHILAELASLGAELIGMPRNAVSGQGLFWRFLAADDPTVRRFLCRDCDSRITARERATLREWLESGQPFHAMRDHVMHMELIQGGLWGGTAGLLPPVGPTIDAFTANRSSRWNDQHFLAEWLWPRVVDRILVHDGVHGALGRPFPEPVAPGETHVGAKLVHVVRLPEMDAAGTGPWMEATGRHGRLAFPQHAPHIGLSLDTLGEWLEIEAALCARYLKAGGVALDTGAGIGAHALAFARAAGPQGHVVAIEPSPSLFAGLERSLALNPDVSVTARRTLPDGLGDGLGDRLAGLPAGRRIDLVRATLTGPPLDPLVLEDLASHRPVFYFRVAADAALHDAMARLKPLGYRLWWHIAPVFNPANRSGRTGNPFPGLVTVNALALPDGHGDVPSRLAPIDTAGASWRDAVWRLACDGG
ncbi:tetratricopeptide repeat protein [Azospirillum agricola]|uniref:tetratricopeptide repeat protein n=1 Tax=Azospirillum agricola TaxID=1720247 RepID=UPI0015C43EA8|nr:tetratricopeptide repeat protein [Azospirillum agricola]